jgi:hypothetical protein
MAAEEMDIVGAFNLPAYQTNQLVLDRPVVQGHPTKLLTFVVTLVIIQGV